MLGALLVYGLTRSYFGHIAPGAVRPEALRRQLARRGGTLGIFLLLKGFSSGAVALTGVEAISNGVPAFRRPESKNAATTLVWMGVLLGTLFFGISVLAHRLQPYPSHDRTVMAQLGLAVFGNGALFVVLQFATAAILTLAANTAYNGFPSLSSIIAKDGYLPRQLANRGDRLVFSNGIIVLPRPRRPCSSSRSAASRTRSSRSTRSACSRRSRCRSGGWCATTCGCASRAGAAAPCSTRVGAVATLIVLLIVAITKFTDGAWVPIVVIPLIVLLFKSIKRHYAQCRGRARGPTRLPAAAPTAHAWSCSSARSTRACSRRRRTRVGRARPSAAR